MAHEHLLQSPRWLRVTLAGGIAYVILLIVAAAAFPTPGGSQSVAHYPSWLATHYTSTVTQVYLRSLAAIALLSFAVGLSDVVYRLTGRGPLVFLTLVGGAGSATLLLAAQAATAGAALLAHSAGKPGVVQGLGSLEDAILVLSSLPLGLALVALGVALLRDRAWLAYLSLFGGVVAVGEAAIFPNGPLDSIDFLPLVYMLVWTLVTSITLLLAIRACSPSNPARQPSISSLVVTVPSVFVLPEGIRFMR